MKESIIITGASGLLGTAIAIGLSEKYQIIGIDRTSTSQKSIFDHFFEADLTDESSIKNCIAAVSRHNGKKVAAVIHLAAYYDFSGAPSPLYQELTVNGTVLLLEHLQVQGFEVGQFLFSSTHLLMMPAEKGQIIHERSPMQATWDYPQSKINAEKAIKKHRGHIPSVILRISGAYDEQGHSPPICQQIKRIYERQFEGHFYPGDQEKGQPFVHIQDIVSIVKLCVDKRNELSAEEVFLVGGPELLSYGELQSRIGQLIYGKDWETFFVPKFLAKAGAWVKNLQDKDSFIKPWMIDETEAHYPISNQHALKVLGWVPKHRLYDDLEPMIQNLLHNPQLWYEINHLGEAPPTDLRRYQARKLGDKNEQDSDPKDTGTSLGA